MAASQAKSVFLDRTLTGTTERGETIILPYRMAELADTVGVEVSVDWDYDDDFNLLSENEKSSLMQTKFVLVLVPEQIGLFRNGFF
jgi:hypothetical protein